MGEDEDEGRRGNSVPDRKVFHLLQHELKYETAKVILVWQRGLEDSGVNYTFRNELRRRRSCEDMSVILDGVSNVNMKDYRNAKLIPIMNDTFEHDVLSDLMQGILRSPLDLDFAPTSSPNVHDRNKRATSTSCSSCSGISCRSVDTNEGPL
ncbi:hypothetical protein ANN_08291 [Periplaneta americana]|uniref:Uncharacterized protein n=1 Tax=Periplaneta americana TaxID=6978 RepID=A0ABQ8T1N6_PERAM|nr:hypothetical protein ANN_08291 [Periplaneta americana]